MLSLSQTRRIEWGDCDPAGIVFNPRYFAFFDHNVNLLYEAAGWSKPLLTATFGIVGCPLVETRAKFMAPCTFGDEVTITTSVAQVRRSSFDLVHTLTNRGVVSVEGFETRVWSIRDPETGKLRSAPIPPEVAARFTAD